MGLQFFILPLLKIKNDKLSIYDGLTEKNIVINECLYFHHKAFAYWVSKDEHIPLRDCDGMIIKKTMIFTLFLVIEPYIQHLR